MLFRNGRDPSHRPALYNAFKQMLASSGESTPPWGVPLFLRRTCGGCVALEFLALLKREFRVQSRREFPTIAQRFQRWVPTPNRTLQFRRNGRNLFPQITPIELNPVLLARHLLFDF